MVHDMAQEVSGKGKESGPSLNYQDRHSLCTQETSSEGQRGRWDTGDGPLLGCLSRGPVLPSEAEVRLALREGCRGVFPEK